MVKFERPDSSEAHVAIESLKREKRKGSGKYNTNEVNKALGLMFAHKCYLCEKKDLDNLQIEHLVPHRGNRDLMFDWENLFLSCNHCNNIKNDKFTRFWIVQKLQLIRKLHFVGIVNRLCQIN